MTDEVTIWRDCTVVQQQSAIAVYTCQDGSIAIQQRNWPEDDSYVFMAPEHARAVAEALLAEAGAMSQEVVAAKDRTAAERQQRYRDKHRNGTRNGGDRNDAPLLRAAE